MATNASPAAYVAVVAALFLSGIGVSLPIDSTRADDNADDNCLAGPGAAAPSGQHWYYRIDWVKHRKCWFLHATVRLPNHAAAKHPAEPSKPVAELATPQLPSAGAPQEANAASAPQPEANASNTLNEAAGTQPAPPVTVLAVTPVPAPLDDTTSASQAAQPEQAGELPMPQISPDQTSPNQIAPNNANLPVDGAAEPAGPANPATVSGATDVGHTAFAPADAAAPIAARTQSADLFILLALALGGAAALIALFLKIAGRRRKPRLSDHPDDASRRVNHEEDAAVLAPAEPHAPMDLDAKEWSEPHTSAQAGLSAARRQDGEPGHAEQIGLTLKDIERALGVLRQARQGITQT